MIVRFNASGGSVQCNQMEWDSIRDSIYTGGTSRWSRRWNGHTLGAFLDAIRVRYVGILPEPWKEFHGREAAEAAIRAAAK